MIPLLAAAASLLAGAFGAYGLSGVRRAASRVKAGRRAARADTQANAEILESRRKALKESSRRYVDSRVEKRLREVPLDALREGRTVKIKPLQDAGFRTVGELLGKSSGEFRAVKGIGPVSARALQKAARAYAETARRTAPPLPDAGLEDQAAADLAHDTLVFLDAFRALGDAPRRMRGALEAFDRRARDEMRQASFVRWMGRALRRGLNRRHEEKLHALATELDGLRAGGAFAEAAHARAGLRDARLDPAEVRERFRAQYADCCSVLERVFGELDLELDTERVRAPKPGAAPAQTEIARKVEAFALDADGLRVMLRRYQVFGASFLLVQRRTVLGDEMGLGKTIQALAAAAHLAREQEHPYFLVVAPASILGNWMHEIGARTALPATLLHGEDFEDDVRRWVAAGGFGVTSYTTLRRGVVELDHQGPPRLSLLVADEAHYAKNPAAQRTVALVRVADRAERVCFMSGTPLENHPEEFVHLLGSLAPDRARDLDAFLKQPGRVLGGARHFHAEVADVYLRRNQEDVLKELPERIDKEEWIDLGPERAAYRAQVEAGNFMGMRRAVTLGDRGAEPTAKFERLRDILDEYRASGVKVLVFSYFLDVLDEVERQFGALGKITGAVGPERRFEIVQAFQGATGHQVLLGQIDAAGTGLNLQAAGAVVLTEPQLKPTTEAQAVARAHRMGQTRRVVVHRLLARGCVDERLVELLREKSELFEQFARESLVKDASEEATATGIAAAVVKAERERLA